MKYAIKLVAITIWEVEAETASEAFALFYDGKRRLVDEDEVEEVMVRDENGKDVSDEWYQAAILDDPGLCYRRSPFWVQRAFLLGKYDAGRKGA